MKQRNAGVCLLLILCKGLLCCAQITAEDQQKINIIQGWVQEQLKQGKQPTQEQMDSINKASPPQPSPLLCRDKLREGDARAQAKQQDSAGGKALPFGKGGDGLSVITKQCMVGGSLSVPENKRWKIKRVFVTNGIGGGYNILTTSIKFKEEYKSGEKITAPNWSAESSLLTEDASTVSYIFEIEETEMKR